MKLSAAALLAVALLAAGCGGKTAASCHNATRTPSTAPAVALTAAEQDVWAPLPPDRSTVPVLLYHGIGPASDFSNSADASYGVDAADFAKQLTMMKHAGYQTISLATFLSFIHGKQVDLPPHPLLLTFDDGRADSWTGADEILRKLHYTAVMFVDTGRIDACDPEYLTWPELQTMQQSGRWQLQLHAGPHGHEYIRYGAAPHETGPYYAYLERREDFDGWKKRVRSDIDEGQKTLAGHISAYQPLAFAPPYGSYGQDGTNDPRIPDDLLGWLTERYEIVFTQDETRRASPGAQQPLGRIQVTRAVSGGDLHARLIAGK